jgi:hypothetical protein
LFGARISTVFAVSLFTEFIAITASIKIIISIIRIGSVSIAICIATFVTFIVVILSAYMGYYAVIGDEKHALLRRISFFYASIGGTNFRNTDLSSTDFTGATLKGADLRGAIINCTLFYRVKISTARVSVQVT